MCGIAGAIGHLDRRVDEAVARANERQLHRGPDGTSSFRSHDAEAGPGVHFAHRRLAIIVPTDEGRQPMADRSNGNVICFNGEIYNYRELRRELVALGTTFATQTDTEVILASFARWGEGALAKLRGMFAFALLDRATGRTLLARDRLGIKPLYLAHRRHEGTSTVFFASEVRSLLATELVERRLHPDALASYAWNGFVVGRQSIVAGVTSLDAGTSMWVDASGVPEEPRRYWRLPAAGGEPASREELESVLLETVDQHMISDVPLGVFLSGGIDSSAVAALASARAAGRVKTFNISFAEQAFDESPWARRVAEALGTEHHEIRLTQTHFKDQLDDALACLDQPTADALNTYFVSRAARDAGMTVALSGLGGDELFGGYTSFEDIPRARRWSRRAALLPSALVRPLAALVTRLKTAPVGRVPPQTRWGKLADVLATKGDVLGLYQVSYGLFTEDFAHRLSRAAATADVERGLPAAEAARLAALIRGEPILPAISTLELSLFVGERLLRDSDMASMRPSLELRVPFLDHVLVETVARLPEDVRYQPIRAKRALRDAALRRLDPAIFDRKKAGFVLPLDVWSRDALKGRMDAALRDRALCERAGLDPAVVATLWQAYSEGAPGMYWNRMWSVFALLHWVATERASI